MLDLATTCPWNQFSVVIHSLPLEQCPIRMAHQEHIVDKDDLQSADILSLARSNDGIRLIAVDMDDVLSQTTQCIADCTYSSVLCAYADSSCISNAGHNANYGTSMDLSTFYCEHGPPRSTLTAGEASTIADLTPDRCDVVQGRKRYIMPTFITL